MARQMKYQFKGVLLKQVIISLNKQKTKFVNNLNTDNNLKNNNTLINFKRELHPLVPDKSNKRLQTQFLIMQHLIVKEISSMQNSSSRNFSKSTYRVSQCVPNQLQVRTDSLKCKNCRCKRLRICLVLVMRKVKGGESQRSSENMPKCCNNKSK